MKVSGTWQTATKLQVKVSGVWQTVTKAFVKVAGTWQQVYASFVPLSGTLTAANYNGGFTNGYGLLLGGSVSSGAFGAGQTLHDFSQTSTSTAVVITGFSSDPGQNGYFTTATYNGNSLTAATAATYTYSAGQATWSWNSTFTWTIGVAKAFSIT